MAKFCPNCGKEINENNKFCNHCGAKINNNINNTKQETQKKGFKCLYCGNIIPFGLTQCPNCKNYINPKANEKHTAAIVLGYIFSIFIPIIGIIFGIYILTRENKKISKQGIIMIIIAFIMIIIYFLIFSYINYINSFNRYYY